MLVTESIVTSGLTSPQKVLQEIVTFAKARGWTEETGGGVGVEHKKTDSLWDTTSPYNGWEAGDGDMYTLSSTGYGSQNLICRLERRGSHIHLGMLSDKDYTVQQDHPVRQNVKVRLLYQNYSASWDTNNFRAGWSINDGSAQKLYLYGDSTWIMAVLDIDGIYHTHMHFGSLDPVVSSGQTELDTCGSQLVMIYDTGGTIHGAGALYYSIWSDYVYVGHHSSDKCTGAFMGTRAPLYSSSFYGHSFGYYYESEDKVVNSGNSANGDTKYLFEYRLHDADGAGTSTHIFPNVEELLNANNFSGKRPMFKQIYFQERNVDAQYQPVAYSPVWFINFDGLDGGDLLTYGTETYRVFPVGSKAFSDACGIAVRTA